MGYNRESDGCIAIIIGGSFIIVGAYGISYVFNSLLKSIGYEFASETIGFSFGTIVFIGLLYVIFNFNKLLNQILPIIDSYFNRKNIMKLEEEYRKECKLQQEKLKKLLSEKP